MNDIVVFENLRFQRFPESPLRRVFLKSYVFRDRFHRIRVDGTSNRWKKNLRFQIRKDTCGRGPAVCQLKSEWFPRYLLIPRKKINNFFHHTSQESNWTQHFRIDHNVLCHSLPPQNFAKPLGRLQYLGEIGNKGYAKFGGINKVHYLSMWKWWT